VGTVLRFSSAAASVDVTVDQDNPGFYYNAEGIGYSDRTIHIGRYEASLDELRQLEGAQGHRRDR
jgi:hypothetical protein